MSRVKLMLPILWTASGTSQGARGKRARWIVPALALTVATAGCGEADSSDRISVVVTTSILGDVVEEIVGDRADVEVLIPTGGDLHSFQPSSRQVASMQKADLVVAIGLLAEEGLIQVLEAVAAAGVRVLEVAPLVDPIPYSDSTIEHRDHGELDQDEDESVTGEHEDHGDSDLDPHIWLDPLRMAEVAELIGAELTRLDPTFDFGPEAATYAAELREVDQRISEILEPVPTGNRQLVVDHQGFGYFAARYGFEVIGTVVPGVSALADPSSAELAALVATLREHQVRAVFVDQGRPPALAEAVAAELGSDVEVVVLNVGSLGAPGTPSGTLIGMLITNAEIIASALT